MNSNFGKFFRELWVGATQQTSPSEWPCEGRWEIISII